VATGKKTLRRECRVGRYPLRPLLLHVIAGRAGLGGPGNGCKDLALLKSKGNQRKEVDFGRSVTERPQSSRGLRKGKTALCANETPLAPS